MKFRTHIEADIDTSNVSWTFATIQATKRQLVKTFGVPMECGEKVQFKWAIKFNNGTTATVYDWKQSEIADDDLISWNIGALASDANGRAVSAVHNAFREAHGLSAYSKAA